MPSAVSSSEQVPWSIRRVRIRRTSLTLNNTTFPETRKSRRLFGRSSVSNPNVTSTTNLDYQQQQQQEQHKKDVGRRSFLAKPPAPGAARRVLTVLNQPGRPRRTNNKSSNGSPPYNTDQHPSPSSSQILGSQSAVSVSGYEEPNHQPRHQHHHRRRKEDEGKKYLNPNIPLLTAPPINEDNAIVVDDTDIIIEHDDDVDVEADVEIETVEQVVSERGEEEEEEEEVDAIDENVSQVVPVEEEEGEEDTSATQEDRVVKHVSEEFGFGDGVNRVDSVGSSMPSSRGLAIPSSSRSIEVEASEISDDIHSNGDPKSLRQNQTVNSNASSSIISMNPQTNLKIIQLNGEEAFFDTDPVVGVAFDTVGADESDIPDAPTNMISQGGKNINLILKHGDGISQQNIWDNLQQRIRGLQQAVTAADDDKKVLRRRIENLTVRRKDDETLMESLKVRVSEASLEIEQLTRQLKDTRRRMTRRIRDLEGQLELKDNHHNEELQLRKQVERRLRQELDNAINSIHSFINNNNNNTARSSRSLRRSKSRGGNALTSSGKLPSSFPQQTSSTFNFPTNSSSNTTYVTDNSNLKTNQSLSNTTANINTSVPSSSIPVAAIGNADVSARAAAAVGRANTIGPSEPGRMRKGRADIPAAPPRVGTTNRGKTQSKSVTSGRKAMSLTVPTTMHSTQNIGQPMSPKGENHGGSNVVTGNGVNYMGSDISLGPIVDNTNANSSPKTLARRSLIRRAFIAHIQSTRYRSGRMAWFEFFGAEGNHISYDLFARAVRSLAVAADARDKDLELLLDELCSCDIQSTNSEKNTSSISWSMFARFYQKTKTFNETL